MTRIPSRTSRTLGSWIVALACAVLLTACQTTDSGSSSDGAGDGGTQQADGGFVAPVEPAPAPAPEANVELRPVYFGFDRSELTQEARASLSQDAEALAGQTGTTMVEGHTDERGTFEYNVALGDRRANAVKKYLVAHGIPASKIRTKSSGEAKPAVKGHDESAWRWNRRAVLTQ